MTEAKKRFNFTPNLKEYLIKSRVAEDKKFYLPTPENLFELFNLNVIKDQIYYDIEKYKSHFKKENDEEILDFTNIQHILNNKVLNSVLFFLGAMKSKSQFQKKIFLKTHKIILNIYKIILIC